MNDMTAQQFDRLPSYAQREVRRLRAEIERLTDEVARRNAEVAKPWVFVDYLGMHAGPIPIAGTRDSHVTLLVDGKTLDVYARGTHVEISGSDSLLIQPVSGNVVKVAPARWMT